VLKDLDSVSASETDPRQQPGSLAPAPVLPAPVRGSRARLPRAAAARLPETPAPGDFAADGSFEGNLTKRDLLSAKKSLSGGMNLMVLAETPPTPPNF